jgi:hypothetical protein
LKQELQSEVVAHCWKSFARLFELRRHEDFPPMTLARFAIRAVRSGRRIGVSLNINDVTSHYCQNRMGIRSSQLSKTDLNGDNWPESLIADERARPDELVMARIDFSNGFRPLNHFTGKSQSTSLLVNRRIPQPGSSTSLQAESRKSGDF